VIKQVYVSRYSKPLNSSKRGKIPLVSLSILYIMTTNSNRNKGGRPMKGATEKKKYILPPVRLSTTDYIVVKARAKQAGISLTEFQRQCILMGQVVERISAAHLDLYHKLAGIGNNQNQLAHQANTYGYERDAELYHENAMQVNNLIKSILYYCCPIKFGN
jgi:hypothetical protein